MQYSPYHPGRKYPSPLLDPPSTRAAALATLGGGSAATGGAMAPPVAALPPPSVASAAALVLGGSNSGDGYFRPGWYGEYCMANPFRVGDAVSGIVGGVWPPGPAFGRPDGKLH